jgi:hypothetical protein
MARPQIDDTASMPDRSSMSAASEPCGSSAARPLPSQSSHSPVPTGARAGWPREQRRVGEEERGTRERIE